jgi:hypothetical protein
MTWKLFLDDLRAPPDGSWVVARSVAAATEHTKTYGLPLAMSLDHDLGDGADAPGYLWFLINGFLDGHFSQEVMRIRMHVHSANPVGLENLNSLWKCFINAHEHVRPE